MTKLVAALLFAALLACRSAAPEDGEELSAALSSSEWRLVRIDGAPLIAGTEITLAFDSATGRISGRGGANRYFGSFALTGAKGFDASQVGATKMYLAEPEGVMDQEGRYFGRLAKADGIRLEGGRLELLEAGRTTLEFEGR